MTKTIEEQIQEHQYAIKELKKEQIKESAKMTELLHSLKDMFISEHVITKIKNGYRIQVIESNGSKWHIHTRRFKPNTNYTIVSFGNYIEITINRS